MAIQLFYTYYWAVIFPPNNENDEYTFFDKLIQINRNELQSNKWVRKK